MDDVPIEGNINNLIFWLFFKSNGKKDIIVVIFIYQLELIK